MWIQMQSKMKGVAINFRDFRDFNLIEYLNYKRLKEDNYGFTETISADTVGSGEENTVHSPS